MSEQPALVYLLYCTPATPTSREGFDAFYISMLADGKNPQAELKAHIDSIERNLAETAIMVCDSFRKNYRKNYLPSPLRGTRSDLTDQLNAKAFFDTAEIDMAKLKSLSPLERQFVAARVELAKFITEHGMLCSAAEDAKLTSSWAQQVIKGEMNPAQSPRKA